MTELRADERRDLDGVIVSLDGAIALEAYFNGEGPDTLHDMRSAGKSITSLAVGIAIDRGLVPSVDARLTTLLPEPRAPDKAQIRLEDVLTMRQIVSRAWIRRSLTGIVPIAFRDPYADAYGYMWYLKPQTVGTRTVAVHFASGNGGNKIYVVPSFGMVVAITSSAYGRGYGQRRSQEILLRILAATTHANRSA